MKERKGVNRYVKLLVLCMGASAIYLLPYLRWTYYDVLLEAIGITNKQFGITMSVYGVASMIFYAPGGWMADRFSPRKLLTAAFIITGILGLYFATYPGYLMQILIHFVWGCAATLIFWAAMLKATRQFGNSDEQGKLFGLLEGGRGLMSTIFSAVSLFAFGKLGESIGGLTGIIVAIAIVNIIAGILVWFVFDDSNQSQEEESRINLKMVGEVLRMPTVWLLAFVIITCYSVYIGSTYMTPYFTQVLGATASISALIAIIRNYVLQLLGGPSGGFLATKMKSTTRVVTICFVMIVITLGGIAFLPSKASMLIFLVVLMILMCSAIFAMRGIYFAIVDEVNVPLNVTGTAVGIISVIGFLPDVYMNTIAGSLLDKYPGAAGYRYLFVIMLLFSVVGLIASCLLLSKIKKQKAELFLIKGGITMTAKPIFELLTQDSREKIIQQSFSLLEEQGVDVNSPKALECLVQAGCTADGVRVKIPRKLVKTSIESAPSVIKIYDRNGKEAMDLGKQNTYFGPGPTCPNFFDAYTGERRKAVKNDAALAAVLTDALPNIDFAMSLCMIGDKTKELADIHEIDAMIRNTTKPLVGWAFNARNLQIIIDMCAVTAGSLEALQEKPFIIIYSEPTTPFVHSRDALEKLMLLAENNIPCVYTPGMIMGATAPVTVAGALSVGLCECLTGLVLSQAVRKGAPFIGGAPGGPMDMKTMQHSYGAPEWVLLHSASVEVFHALDLPVFTAAGASDSKTVDAQSAAEAMLQIIGALGTGGNLIHDVGFMDLGMTGSPLHLVMCDELIGMARRMMEGVPVDEEHLAREVIEDVGPGGNFLSEEHTFEFFRDEIWNPSLMDRHTYKDWQKAGSKTMTKRAQDKMLELLQTHRPKLLQDAILKKLDQLVETAEQDFTGNPL